DPYGGYGGYGAEYGQAFAGHPEDGGRADNSWHDDRHGDRRGDRHHGDRSRGARDDDRRDYGRDREDRRPGPKGEGRDKGRGKGGQGSRELARSRSPRRSNSSGSSGSSSASVPKKRSRKAAGFDCVTKPREAGKVPVEATPQRGLKLAPGRKADVKGLKGASQYNGCEGIVIEGPNDKGRWEVQSLARSNSMAGRRVFGSFHCSNVLELLRLVGRLVASLAEWAGPKELDGSRMDLMRPSGHFGAEARKHFLLEDGFTFLNHGAFGATLRSCLESKRQWAEYIERQPVGIEPARTYCNYMARDAAMLLADAWGTELGIPEELLSTMALVQLPELKALPPGRHGYDEAELVQNALYARKIEVPVKALSGKLYVRSLAETKFQLAQVSRGLRLGNWWPH
ncbi:unnamed protein product, partial [Effrenium voratum]